MDRLCSACGSGKLFLHFAGGSELDEYANGQSSGQDHERDSETPASPAKSDRDFTDSPPDIQVCLGATSSIWHAMTFICAVASMHWPMMPAPFEQPSISCQF